MQTIFKSKRCLGEKCFLSLYSLFCLIICLYNIFKICEIYFEFKTTTFVKYENISKISLPAITLCVSKSEVWKNSDSRHPLEHKEILKIISDLPIKEQFKQLYDFKDIFYNCTVMKTIGLQIDSLEPMIACNKVSPIKK